MKIVLCEDNEIELLELKDRVSAYMNEKQIPLYEISAYSDSRSVSFDLEDQAKADVYIIDIDMPEINGIELAKRIYNKYPYAILFFYTSHAEYAREGYRANARRFIMKNDSDELFNEAMNFAVSEYQKQRNDCITFQWFRDIVNIPKKEIVYVAREIRITTIYTSTMGVYRDNRGINDIFTELDNPAFVFLDRGTFINIDYCMRTDQNTVTMFDGKVLVIGRKRIQKVKEAILNRWKR